jgi:hypothetical protein
MITSIRDTHWILNFSPLHQRIPFDLVVYTSSQSRIQATGLRHVTASRLQVFSQVAPKRGDDMG